ncbi:MAG: type II toxin-antitoxin system RelE/ParE family toxin [Terricaulis silvestris]
MNYKIERLRQATNDLDAIFDFLVESYLNFGDSLESAVSRSAQRVERIKADLRSLATLPHRGIRHDDLVLGLRSVTIDRAIFYFTVDDEARVVRVLAVFFGGQEHQRAMLKRLLSEG